MFDKSRYSYHLIVLLIPFMVDRSPAQSTEDDLVLSAPSALSDTLLRLTFPADGDTFSFGHVRFGAWTPDTSAIVTVNGTLVDVYPSGAVVGMFDLDEYPKIVNVTGIVNVQKVSC